jgi:hypothetical protein
MTAALLLAVLAGAPLPLEPGTYWVYRETYTEHLGALDAHSDELTRFEVRGSAERPFVLQTGGVDPASAPVEWGPDWLRLGPWTGEDALPLPLEVGRAAPAQDGGGAVFVVEAAEEVEVPAGTFTALRCALRTSGNESVLWIAPGVGVVREVQGQPGRRPEIERVLLRWGRPTPRP